MDKTGAGDSGMVPASIEAFYPSLKWGLHRLAADLSSGTLADDDARNYDFVILLVVRKGKTP